MRFLTLLLSSPLILALFIGQATLVVPKNASAMMSVCSWYIGDHDAPWVYATHTYSSTSAYFGNMVDLFTVMTSPIFATASDFYNVNPAGNTHGHEAMASIGPYYYHESEMVIGVYAPLEDIFTPAVWTDCAGGFQFEVPSVAVVVAPTVATVGDPVTITWGSNNADMCLFDNAPIALSGVHNFTAALIDSRSYTLECQNQWGWGSDTATLVVNEPTPDCPIEPVGISGINYILQTGTTPGAENIGRFGWVGVPTLAVEAYCATNEWRLKVVGSQHTVRIDVDLLNLANIEVTAQEMDNASCSVLQEMRTSVASKASSVNASIGGWYLYQAAYKHEEVHMGQYTNSFDIIFAASKTAIESLAIPLASASNASDARGQLIALPGYTNERANLDMAPMIASLDLGHSPTAPFIAAQQLAVQPVLSELDARLSNCP